MIIETKGEQRFKNREEQLTDRSVAFIWHLVLAIESFGKGHLDEIPKEVLVQRSQLVLAKRRTGSKLPYLSVVRGLKGQKG